MVMAWQQDSRVMLSAAKHLDAPERDPSLRSGGQEGVIACNDVPSLLVCPAALALWNPGPVA